MSRKLPPRYPIGAQFGRLRVVGVVNYGRLACRCQCGAIITTKVHLLRDGRVKSCGCLRTELINNVAAKGLGMRRIDLTGYRFGTLTVIKQSDGRRWLCHCSCGGEIQAWFQNLRNGRTVACKSCGIASRRWQSCSERDIIVYHIYKTFSLTIAKTAMFFNLSKSHMGRIIEREWRTDQRHERQLALEMLQAGET